MKGVQKNVVPGFITRELVVVQIKYGESKDQKDVVVCSAYFPLDSVEIPRPAEFKELLKYCSEKKLKLLLGRDAHAHHTVWGGSDVNPRGESLCDYLMAHDPQVQNKGKAPTFITRVRQEVLVFTICSICVQKLIHGWGLSDEPSLLGHRYILCRTGTPKYC